MVIDLKRTPEDIQVFVLDGRPEFVVVAHHGWPTGPLPSRLQPEALALERIGRQGHPPRRIRREECRPVERKPASVEFGEGKKKPAVAALLAPQGTEDDALCRLKGLLQGQRQARMADGIRE